MKHREKIGRALTNARAAADEKGVEVLRTSDLSREDREVLVAGRWLMPVVRGWYLLTRPDTAIGDSGPWYAHFWQFVGRYLEERFGNDYCLSAESSLGLHTGDTLVPEQVIAIVLKGAGNPVTLPFDTSLLAYADPKGMPTERAKIDGIWVMLLPHCLARLSPSTFQKRPQEVQIALGMVADIGELSRALLQGDHRKAAERLVGAYLAMDDVYSADRLRDDLASGGIRVRSAEPPFAPPPFSRPLPRSPYAARVESNWMQLREQVLAHFPKSPGLPKDSAAYMASVEEVYSLDAYHSLSIEGYNVSPNLIDRVQNHNWNSDENPGDQQEHRAMAARGYYEAFLEVKQSVRKLLEGASAGEVVENDLQTWYRALWAPQVRAELLEAHDVIGYRRGPVFIRGSRHTPPPREALMDSMEALYGCLKQEPEAAVRAILGHYLFVFIHPFPDGNGRIGRFLMNSMLGSGGYPWTVIRVEHRQRYFQCLENIHLSDDIGPFAAFVAEEMGNR